MSFEDRLAHKLYRQYSKDEAVAFLKGKLEETERERDALLKEVQHKQLMSAQYQTMYRVCRAEKERSHQQLEEAIKEQEFLMSSLTAEKKAERMAFKESEAAKKVKALQYDRRRLKAERAMWRDRFTELAHTLLSGDIEGAKFKAAIIQPTAEPEQAQPTTEVPFTGAWWDRLMRNVVDDLNEFLTPKKKK